MPDTDREAIGDLVRAREDVKATPRQARQRRLSFVLRPGRVCRDGVRKGTTTHRCRLETPRVAHHAQQVVFQEDVDQVDEATQRVAGLTKPIEAAMRRWWRR